MDHTQFAGLTRLAPGEALSEDGYSFQNRNPEVIDHFLRLIVTHRHDAHAALANPTTDPTVTTNDTGGSIPADTDIFVSYTLLDADGGETLPNPVVRQVTTVAGLVDPTDAPVLTLDTTAGDLLSNSYSYAVTVTDGFGGETALSPAATINVPPSANARVLISGLSSVVAAAGGTGWRLWRQVAGGDWALYGTGLAATDAITDDAHLACDCGVTPPTVTGNTRATSQLSVTVPGGQPADAEQFSIYASLDGTFSDPALLGTYPITDAGTAKIYNALNFLAGSPPPVATAVAGSTLISGGGGGGGGGLFTYPQDWDTGSLDVTVGGTTRREPNQAVVGVRAVGGQRTFLYDGPGEWEWTDTIHFLPSSTGLHPGWTERVSFFDADAPGMRDGTATVKFSLPTLDTHTSGLIYALIGHQFGPRSYAALTVNPDGSGGLGIGVREMLGDGVDDSIGWAAAAAGTIAGATDYWLRVTRQGAQVGGDLFTVDPQVNPAAVPVLTVALTNETSAIYDRDFRANAQPGFGWEWTDTSDRAGVLAISGLKSHAASGGEGYKPSSGPARMRVEDNGSTIDEGLVAALNFVGLGVTDNRPDDDSVTISLPGLHSKTVSQFNSSTALTPVYSGLAETNLALYQPTAGDYEGVKATAAGDTGIAVSDPANNGPFDQGGQYTRAFMVGVAADDKFGVIVRSLDANNYLLARMDNSTAAPKLQLISVDAGVETVLASINIVQYLTGDSASPWDVATPLWLACEFEPTFASFGASLYAMDPDLSLAKPEHAVGIRLTGATRTKYQALALPGGGYGFQLQPAAGGGNTLRLGEMLLKGD